MKFAVVAALALAAVASAQNLQINDPTPTTTWEAGKTGYIRWTGVCSNLGADGKTVKVDIINGPADSVHFITQLGVIDCTVASNNSIQLPVPKDVQGSPLETGKYSLRFNLGPNPQYSPAFTINGAAPAPVTPPPTGSNPSTPSPSANPKPAAANTLVAGSALAMAAAAAAAQLIL
ncbi:hypothetical protein BGZ95_010823 [Linnemannia exigua]|uniref:Uncharacterized protein n=1 Tax=Linnemannia exigua TaxID=604196 RepID=A0AAD4H5L9_9FUNG|nr:hypothetical protein BGZ95_010823 [Linnemannia exigua]